MKCVPFSSNPSIHMCKHFVPTSLSYIDRHLPITLARDLFTAATKDVHERAPPVEYACVYFVKMERLLRPHWKELIRRVWAGRMTDTLYSREIISAMDKEEIVSKAVRNRREGADHGDEELGALC